MASRQPALTVSRASLPALLYRGHPACLALLLIVIVLVILLVA